MTIFKKNKWNNDFKKSKKIIDKNPLFLVMNPNNIFKLILNIPFIAVIYYWRDFYKRFLTFRLPYHTPSENPLFRLKFERSNILLGCGYPLSLSNSYWGTKIGILIFYMEMKSFLVKCDIF